MKARVMFPAAAAALVLASTAGAQVGYPPSASPFQDLVYHQAVDAELGWFLPLGDPAGVAPKAGPLVGVRYSAQLGNPLVLSARLATAFSERDVIDPGAAPGERLLRTQGTQLYMADVNVGIALTGFRSWRGLVPEASIGGGLVADFKDADEGGYKFGAPFAISLSGGVRWTPANGRIRFRADLTDRVYKVAYPQSYYQTTGGEPVLGARESNSLWTHNPSITIGIGYLFDR